MLSDSEALTYRLFFLGNLGCDIFIGYSPECQIVLPEACEALLH